MSDESFLDFEAPAVDEHWQPTTDGECEWALLKIKASQAEVERRARERALAIEKWDRYVDAAKREAQREQSFFEAKLHGYLLALLDAGKLGKKKSHQLPSARLQLRHVDEKWEPTDKEALRKWAEATETMRVIWEPDMSIIRGMCSGGLGVPGMAMVRQAGDTFGIIWVKDDGKERADEEI